MIYGVNNNKQTDQYLWRDLNQSGEFWASADALYPNQVFGIMSKDFYVVIDNDSKTYKVHGKGVSRPNTDFEAVTGTQAYQLWTRAIRESSNPQPVVFAVKGGTALYNPSANRTTFIPASEIKKVNASYAPVTPSESPKTTSEDTQSTDDSVDVQTPKATPNNVNWKVIAPLVAIGAGFLL
jgi:hypothetical protein